MEPQSEPNIVWLVTDHHVFKHHGTQGGPRPALPAYERLCRQGTSFPNAYSVCPICTPARASMLTGVYPHKHGMTMNNGDCGCRIEFEPDAKLFNHYLKNRGYRTAYFGKWHCGEKYRPRDFGFEGWSMPGYGHPYHAEEYADYLKELNLPQASVNVEWHLHDPSRTGRGILLKDEPDCTYRMESCGVLETPVETHEAFFVTHLARKWLRKAANKDTPFFMRVDVWGPHQPYFVGKPFADSVNPRDIPLYPGFNSTLEDKPRQFRDFKEAKMKNATISSWEQWQSVIARAYEHATQVDSALGTVITELEKLDLLENTIIIYTADHGDAIASHGGLFDKDSLMIEETERVPLVISWPGKIPFQELSQLVSNMDIVATTLEAAGIQIPSDMDSRSFFSLAENPRLVSWPEELMCQHHGHGHKCFQRMLRWKNLKYVARLDDLDELYDLEKDPYEQNNLINNKTMRTPLDHIRQRLIQTMEQYKDNSEDSIKLRDQLRYGI